MNYRNILWVAIILLATSCVPLKQFQDLQTKNEENRTELNRLRNQNEDFEVENDELKADLKRLKEKVSSLEQDTLRLAKANWKLRNTNDRLSKEYAALVQKYQGNASDDSSDLLAHLQSLHEELQRREDELLRAERDLNLKRDDLDAATAQLSETQQELEQRNARLFELERTLQQKDSAINALKSAVARALTDFGDDELSVYTKNGKVYVSMEEKLLFQSGSYQVSAQGQNAIQKIAGILEQKTDINILIEGHTDNVPYKSQVLLDNWDLSVKRATSVVRIITNNSNIDPQRITAAGRSQFVPLEDANTPEARRKNRRTEIILAPNLDQIFDILNH